MSGALTELAAHNQKLVDNSGRIFQPQSGGYPEFARNPSLESVEGDPNFGRRCVLRVPRNGDLLHRCYVRAVLPAVEAQPMTEIRWVKEPGHELLRRISVSIGEQEIVQHTGTYLSIWSDLTDLGAPKRAMIGESLSLLQFDRSHEETTLYTPLKFFFNEELSASLPLVALQYHNVKMTFDLAPFDEMLYVRNVGMSSSNLYQVGIFEATGDTTLRMSGTDAELNVSWVPHDGNSAMQGSQDGTVGQFYTMVACSFTPPELMDSAYRVGMLDPYDSKQTVTLTTGLLQNVAEFTAVEGVGVLHRGRNQGDVEVDVALNDQQLLVAGQQIVIAGSTYTIDSVSIRLAVSINDIINSQKYLGYTIYRLRPINGDGNDDVYFRNNHVASVRYPQQRPLVDFKVLCDFVYLNPQERALVAREEHHILFTQTRTQTVPIIGETSIDLNFFFPVKEIMWVIQLNSKIRNNVRLDFRANNGDHLLKEARILLNGHERCPWMDAPFYYLVTNFQSHNDYSDLFVYLFSFANVPEARQPTGALNFSKIDTTSLQVRPDPRYVNEQNPATLTVFANNHNVLRVVSGMAGVKWAN